MSVLMDKLKLYFGFGSDEQVRLALVAPRSDEQKLAIAAADRGYAFGLLEMAEEALVSSAKTEYEVCGQSLRRVQEAIDSSTESAARIIANGIASSLRHKDAADQCQRNGDNDELALSMLASLFAYRDDPESPNGPGPLEGV